jgi:sensor histidine kinase regulating citrate/malate metabolism
MHDGIGLALVQRAVASAGGVVTTERLTQGVSFMITVPKPT